MNSAAPERGARCGARDLKGRARHTADQSHVTGFESQVDRETSERRTDRTDVRPKRQPNAETDTITDTNTQTTLKLTPTLTLETDTNTRTTRDGPKRDRARKTQASLPSPHIKRPASRLLNRSRRGGFPPPPPQPGARRALCAVRRRRTRAQCILPRTGPQRLPLPNPSLPPISEWARSAWAPPMRARVLWSCGSMPRAEALAGVARRRNCERGLGTGSGDGLHEAATVEGAQRDGEPVGLAGKQV